MKYCYMLVVIFLLQGLTDSYAYAQNSLADEVSYIQYEVTAIEHRDGDKIEEFSKLIDKASKLVEQNPNSADAYLWKGIALSAKAKHQGISALSSVKEAKSLLEKSIAIDPKSSDGAAYNALAMLYYKVPAWPIAFGDNDKAAANFKKALEISSNIDTNYRYGEFLAEEGQSEEARKYLQKAYDLPNRPSHREDPLKKEEILALLNKLKN